MDLERLGSLHQSRLSFMRALVRRIMRERWRIDASRFELDADGHGTAIYRIHTQRPVQLRAVLQYLAPEKRNDRVIASEWDLTMALCEGEVDPALDSLRRNVPLQEAGRLDARNGAVARQPQRAQLRLCRGRAGPGRQPDADHACRLPAAPRRSTAAASWACRLGKRSGTGILISPAPSPRKCSPVSCCNFSLRQGRISPAIARPPRRWRSNRRSASASATRRPGHGALINHPQLISRWVEMRERRSPASSPPVAAAAPPAAVAGPRAISGRPIPRTNGRPATTSAPSRTCRPVRLAGRRAAGILESAAGVGDAPLQPAGPGTAQLHPDGTAGGWMTWMNWRSRVLELRPDMPPSCAR